MSIHPTAVINPSATIGNNVRIGPFAVIGAGVTIGNDTQLGPHAVILSNTKVGDSCQIHSHAVLGDAPQDVAYNGALTRVEIGNKVVIREGVTIHRGTKEGTITRVADGCFLMANSHLAHNVNLGEKVIVANGALLAGYVEVGAGVFISGNAVVHQFCHIGRLAMLGGASAVSKDVPPFCTAATGEYNRIAGLNVIGLRRAGFTSEKRLEIKRAFDLLYRSGLTPAQAIERIKTGLPAGPAQEIAEFAEASKRGVCSMARGASADE